MLCVPRNAQKERQQLGLRVLGGLEGFSAEMRRVLCLWAQGGRLATQPMELSVPGGINQLAPRGSTSLGSLPSPHALAAWPQQVRTT